jgi:hypothetical protein
MLEYAVNSGIHFIGLHVRTRKRKYKRCRPLRYMPFFARLWPRCKYYREETSHHDDDHRNT